MKGTRTFFCSTVGREEGVSATSNRSPFPSWVFWVLNSWYDVLVAHLPCGYSPPSGLGKDALPSFTSYRVLPCLFMGFSNGVTVVDWGPFSLSASTFPCLPLIYRCSFVVRRSHPDRKYRFIYSCHNVVRQSHRLHLSSPLFLYSC